MTLEIVWFCAIAVLWGGYFVLEGFDFGVGMLLPFLARDEDDRSELLETIGPLWDGNEVWLVIAAGATFAAFPAWYATMFSALLPRPAAHPRAADRARASRSSGASATRAPRWRGAWRWANTVSSVGAPFLWGVALASLLYGIPLDGNGHFTGDVLDLFNGYTVARRGRGRRAVRPPRRDVPLAAHRRRAARAGGRRGTPAQPAVAVVVVGVPRLDRRRRRRPQRPRRARAGSCRPRSGGVALLLGVLFARARAQRLGVRDVRGGVASRSWRRCSPALYRRVLVSAPNPQNSLTISGAATEHYALSVITVVAAVLLPVMLLYQGWTYHVFRARLGGAPPSGVAPAS